MQLIRRASYVLCKLLTRGLLADRFGLIVVDGGAYCMREKDLHAT